MTPQQLVDVLQRRQALFDAAVAATDAAGVPGMNPLVADALASAPKTSAPSVTPSSAPGKVNVTLGGALGGATVPFITGAKAPASATPETNTKAPEQGVAPESRVTPEPLVDDTHGGSFYDMLLKNDAYRLQNKDAFERNEKANRARTAIAAVTDALASLGNLVGTTQGAFSQPQTYQTPFVTEQVESDRARARQLADRIQANDQTIRLAQAREEMTNGTYALRQALEEEKTRRAQMNNEARADLEGQRQEGRLELEKLKQEGRVSLRQMDIDYKQNKDEMQAALRQQGIRISAGRLSEMIRHNQTIEKIREKGGGGGVGGYETVIIRDEFGREIRRKRVPLGTMVDLDDMDRGDYGSSGSGSSGGSGSGSGGGKKGGFSTGGKKGGFS